MNVVKKLSKYFFILGAIYIVYLFRYISVRAPLAGDDWGYYLSGQDSILKNALNFYITWSGRLFCEIWGFAMASHKEIWNAVNPVLFLLIFISIYFIGSNNKPVTSVFFIIAMMLSVYFQIRTQTYTWIAGGNYSVSLCLSLLYFLLIDKLLSKDLSKRTRILICILTNIILIIIGLMIENIALTMIIGIVIIIVYLFIKNKRHLIKFFCINLIVSTTGFAITRLSPGSNFRLMRDHPEWIKLSVFEKITEGYHYFIQYGFINNSYTIALFSILIIGLIWFGNKKKNNILKTCYSAIMFVGILAVFSSNIFNIEVFLNDDKSLFSMLFWPVYCVVVFLSIIEYMPNGFMKDKAFFFLLIGGLSAGAMMMSPVNGARSYVYLVYYIILTGVIVFNSYDCNKYINLLFIIGLSFIIYTKNNYYKNLYNDIEYAQQKRLVKIKYYQEHPEDKEVWIERFPENALHSIDIEKGDDYHFEVFKEYYNLPQNANNIVFYFDK